MLLEEPDEDMRANFWMTRLVIVGERSASPLRRPCGIAAMSCSGRVVLEHEAARAGAQRFEDVFVEVECRENQNPRRVVGTVHTAPERLARWATAVAAGIPRSGLTYSPTAGCSARGLRFPRALDRLFPEYQHVAVGDIVCDGPNYESYFRVQHVDPPHALVYRSIRHPRRGSPIDIDEPESPSKIENSC